MTTSEQIFRLKNGRESPWFRSVAAVVSLLAGVGIGLCSLSALSQSDFARYDQMLRNHESVPLTVALARAPQTPELFVWMHQRADEGHPIVQYALARALVSSNKAEALKWTAMGRMNYALDSIECLSKSKSVEVSALLELGYQTLQSLADANELLWAQGMEAAINVEEARVTRPPPYWICDPGNPSANESSLLASAERTRQRKRQFDFLVSRGFIRAMEARLNANLNPDGFAMYGPDPKYHAGKWSRGDAMVWVDDDSLIFGGFINAGERDDAPTPMYLWKISTNGVKLIVEDGFGICKFGQDFYSYFVRRNGKRYWREGKLDDMTEIEFNISKSYSKRRCRIHPDEKPQSPFPYWELEHGGKLKSSKTLGGSQVRIEMQPHNSDTWITLPFSWEEIKSYSIGFSQYAGAYVMQGEQTRLNPQKAGQVWLLWPNGKVAETLMPRGPWAESSVRYFPIRLGWLVRLDNRGLYMVRENKITKILKGGVSGIDVSPNGCRAAVKVHWSGGGLGVIDFCKSRSE